MAGDQPISEPRGQSPEQRTDAASRLSRLRRAVIWPESIIAGVTVWFVGFLLTYLPLRLLDVGGDKQLEFAILVYYESVGGSVFEGVDSVVGLATTGGYQAALDSNAFGAGPAVQMLLPALVMLVGGYVLAGRHISAGATERPLETILAGASLAVWFTVVLFLAVAVADEDAATQAVTGVTAPDGLGPVFAQLFGNPAVNLVGLFLVALLYAGVFATVGATIRSRARLASGWGLLAGFGAFLLGLLPWFLLGNPFDRVTDADSLSDLDGLKEQADLLAGFVGEHGLGVSTMTPAWFVVLVPLLVGAVLAYGYEERDPVVGAGTAAKLGVGYVIPVFLVVVAQAGLTAQEFEDQAGNGQWSEASVEAMNYLLGTVTRSVLLAGIVYPVVFAAIGGVVGTVAYRAQQATDDQRQQQQYRQGQSPQTGRETDEQANTPHARQPAGETEQQPTGAGGYQQGSTQHGDQQSGSYPAESNPQADEQQYGGYQEESRTGGTSAGGDPRRAPDPEESIDEQSAAGSADTPDSGSDDEPATRPAGGPSGDATGDSAEGSSADREATDDGADDDDADTEALSPSDILGDEVDESNEDDS